MTTKDYRQPTDIRWMLLPALIAFWLLVELLVLIARQPISPVVALHAATALTAVLLGTVALSATKGSRLHRVAGYSWISLMSVVAISSFWIRTLPWFPGGFGPIHILSVTTLWSLVGGLVAARQGRIQAHRTSMLMTLWGLLGAGVFTLLPHRLMGMIAWGGL
ncbi:DUF2306 domain-containing protein [Saccharospirillum mangrovi]|uniref:DUF2306 domain-containing protein n=1 Tax=Saccharospirillum mangrovi TaxID=2161747 RepID=UPI0018E4E1F6|nr:DUF2306 domain-containing protein [Saccharospirillum mangrovi]